MSVYVEGYRNESFEALEAAVMETPRGRWFLEEYAKRQRSKETLGMLASLRRLESFMTSSLAGAEAPQLKAENMKFFKRDEDLFEPALSTLQAETTTIKPPAEARGAKLRIHHNEQAPITTTAEAVISSEPLTIENSDQPIVAAEAIVFSSALGDEALNPPVEFKSEHKRAEPASTAHAEAKPRVVIIRKAAEDMLDIPLPDAEKTEASA